jgi:hypothetical protein
VGKVEETAIDAGTGKAEDVAEVNINSMKDRSATGALIDGRLFS